MRIISNQTVRFLWLAASLCCAGGTVANAQTVEQSVEQTVEQNPAGRVVSERAVAILRMRCIACHGSEKAEGELRLDSLEHLLHGGERAQ